ncbi:MAG: phosphate ABC transporter permease subunit PstC [Pseudomonadota bacterium]|nr:phosphate ABC transporter permease subunit PstC [Pseudomonadota bacterium]
MTLIILLILFAAAFGYYIAQSKAATISLTQGKKLNSLPMYHGVYVLTLTVLPLLLIILFWMLFKGYLLDKILFSILENEFVNLNFDQINLLAAKLKNMYVGQFVSQETDPNLTRVYQEYVLYEENISIYFNILVFFLSILIIFFLLKKIKLDFPARKKIERLLTIVFFLASIIAVLTTVGIISSLFFETVRFFDKINPLDFLFGLQWSPQTAIRSDQVAAQGAFGIIPLLVGTLLTTLIAMFVAVPFGLMSAIYLAEYAHPRTRAIIKPALEILAGIPTVVYGFFAAITVAPFIRDLGDLLGLEVASESALAAGLVMGIMIIPFVSSMSDDVITAVPRSLREGSWGLGATRSETILQVVLPAALAGIVGSVLLAVSRAIGETMIVVMAAGLAANLTFNPLEAVSTVTVQIVTLLVGDQEFDSAKTLAAFALGMTLFFFTLILNVIALAFVKRYREVYE